jgi:hypothetical protein
MVALGRLGTPEIHGYRAECGYRVYVDKALEIAATTRPEPLRETPDGGADSNHGEAAPAHRNVKDASL